MYKGALVLEGGAMRGVYTSGVLDVLMEKNIEIENVYGISAGAKNSQYYISKQPGEAIKVDLYCSHNKKAIGVKNFVKNDGVINSHYYNDFIMKYFAPLDMEKFNTSKQHFYIGATNCLTGNIHYFEKSSCDVRKAIVASCSIPIVQNMIMIDNVPYLDGGIAENIPYKTAMKDGNKKIVVVSTRPKGYRANGKFNRLHRFYKAHYRHFPNLVSKLITNDDRYDKMLDEIDELEQKGEIFVIRPSADLGIGMLEKEEEQIVSGYEMGKADMIKLLPDLIAYLSKE